MLLSIAGEDDDTSANVAVVDAVVGVPVLVDAVSVRSEVDGDGLPVVMVVCLVIVTIELFGIV